MTEFVKAVLKHFDFTTPKGLKITPRDEKKIGREEQEREDKRVEEKKRLTFLLIFIPSTLELCREKKMFDFYNNVFINPEIRIF